MFDLEEDFISLVEVAEKLAIKQSILLSNGVKNKLPMHAKFYDHIVVAWDTTQKLVDPLNFARRYIKEEINNPSYTAYYHIAGDNFFSIHPPVPKTISTAPPPMGHGPIRLTKHGKKLLERQQNNIDLQNFYFKFLFFSPEDIRVYRFTRDAELKNHTIFFHTMLNQLKKNNIQPTNEIIVKLLYKIEKTLDCNLLRFGSDYTIKQYGEGYLIKLHNEAKMGDLIVIQRESAFCNTVKYYKSKIPERLLPDNINDIYNQGYADVRFLYPVENFERGLATKASVPLKVTVADLLISREDFERLRQLQNKENSVGLNFEESEADQAEIDYSKERATERNARLLSRAAELYPKVRDNKEIKAKKDHLLSILYQEETTKSKVGKEVLKKEITIGKIKQQIGEK